jgi:uncharacterized protein (DUF433 family)
VWDGIVRSLAGAREPWLDIGNRATADLRRIKSCDDPRLDIVETVSIDNIIGGKPRLAGRRISVLQVAEMVLEDSHTPETVADQLDCSLAEVHTALAYYYDNPGEMASLRERREQLDRQLRGRALTPDQLEQ